MREVGPMPMWKRYALAACLGWLVAVAFIVVRLLWKWLTGVGL